MKKFYKSKFQKLPIILLVIICMLPFFLQAQLYQVSLTNYQGCGGATMVPFLQFRGKATPATVYYERLSSANAWQLEGTQVYNFRNSYIQYNGNDILQPAIFRVRVLDEITGTIYTSNSVSVDPTTWNVDRGTAWSTAYATWGGNCNKSNYINIESNTLGSGRPPFTMQYKKQGEANYSGGGETTGNGLIPNIEFGINYDVRITDKCGKIVNLNTRLYLSCSTGDVVLPSGCQTADGNISIFPSNDNRYVGIPPYTYYLRKTGPGNNDTAFVSNHVFDKLSSGTYDYAIRDGCGHTSFAGSVVLGSATPECNAGYDTNKSDSCYNDITITPTKGTGPFTYGLSLNKGPFTYSKDSVFKVLADGYYFYTITDVCGKVSFGSQWILVAGLHPVVDSVTRVGTGCIKDFVVHASRSSKPYAYEVTGDNPHFVMRQTSDTFRNLGPNIYKFQALDRCGKAGNEKIILDTVNCNLRTSLGDFESNKSSVGCANISGNKWIDVNDDNGHLIYSVNPNGNALNTVCWGIHVEDNSGRPPRSGNINNNPSYFLDRNFYIEPAANLSLTDSVSIRIYISNYELNNLLGFLANLGIAYNVEDLKILKKKGSPGSPADLSVTNDSLANNSQFTFIKPLVGQFGPDAIYLEFKVKDFSEFNPFVGKLSALPLQIISFTASKQNKAVQLKWTTTQEVNTKSFEVEWSDDGSHFKVIGSVEANNSQLMNNYSFIHSPGGREVNYYRLKQIDKDAKYVLSKIVSVSLTGDASIVIWPNPVHDNLTLQLPANNRYSNIKIIDLNGRILLQKALPASVQKSIINVQLLSNGMYFLEIDGEATQRIKFIKY